VSAKMTLGEFELRLCYSQSLSKAGGSFESGNPFPGKGTLFRAFISLYKIAPLETIIPHPWHEPCYQPNTQSLGPGRREVNPMRCGKDLRGNYGA
jgi:hypothetical protein